MMYCFSRRLEGQQRILPQTFKHDDFGHRMSFSKEKDKYQR